ncbi:GNAT family N-acetyltransferase [Streptomyces sp. NPDC093260]|uniref:GNAT family N-acetyltransferase n=1 Tax=Streptomyces sp. NPDC093260 TaxID=3155073 RepID=UPI0034411779
MSSPDSDEKYLVRAIHADEWPAVKALRLRALRDPIAHLAFLETYEDAAARPDSYWRERTAGAAEGSTAVRQFIAEAPGGEWVGSVTALIEEAGMTDWTGCTVEQRQGHLVGVYVRPEHRGCGLTEVLFDESVQWVWSAGVDRVRLFVHEDNGRAERFYRRFGFVPSGHTVPMIGHPEQTELEYVLERP